MILPAFGELTETSIYVIWGRLVAVGRVNNRTRTDLVSFDASDLFVCGDRVTDLLQPTLKGAFCDGLGHLGHFNGFRYE